MKQLTISLLILLLAASTSFAKSLNLKVGDEFEYYNTSYEVNGESLSDRKVERSESYRLKKYKFRVIEHNSKGYGLSCSYTLASDYYRARTRGSWETINCRHDELQNRYTSDHLKGELDLELYVSNNGDVSGIRVINSSGAYELPQDSTRLKQRLNDLHGFLWSCFFSVPDELQVGSEIDIVGDMYVLESMDDEHLYFSHLEESFSEKEINYKSVLVSTNASIVYDRKRGVIIEVAEDIKWGKDVKTNRDLLKHKIQRNVLVSETPGVFDCQYNDGESTIFSFATSKQANNPITNTNVCIRGKVKTPSQRREVKLSWTEKSALDFKQMSIVVPLKEDSTFEIRLHLDRLTKVTLAYTRTPSFYLLPGDDVFLDVDFDKEVPFKATGIGAKHVNFAFEKAVYEKANHCTNREVGNEFTKRHQVDSPKALEEYAYSVLKKKQKFLSDNSLMVSPEVFLALFWDNQLFIANQLRDSPRIMKTLYRQYKRDTLSDIDDLNFGHLESLLHPDNDLMAFSSDYDSHIRHLVLFRLMSRMKLASGRGIRVFTKTFHDDYYDQLFSYSQTFFTGKTQESLCYNAVLESFLRANWTCYDRLYRKYKTYYPNSHRSTSLDRHYEKVNAVSPGSKPYNFRLLDLDGQSHQLSDYKGKAVHVSFSHVNDESTYRYFGGYKRLCEMYNDSDIVFIHIFLTMQREKVKTVIKDGDLKGVFLVADNHRCELEKAYAFKAAPHFCLIDANGEIVSSSRVSPYDLLDKPSMMSAAMRVELPSVDYEKRSRRLTLYIVGLLVLIVLGGIGFLWNKRRLIIAARIGALNNKLRESELKAIRAQMNPHFIHNCLNSIQNLVLKKEGDKAHLYISKFAMLIRDTLNLSTKQEISLSQEIEMLTNYVALEDLRFAIEFKLDIAPEIDIYSTFIPPMLLQPIIENAIVHGLSATENNKRISVRIYQEGKLVCIEIKDNGIGREATQSKEKSGTGKGTSFTNERLQLLSEKHNAFCQMITTDLYDEQKQACGTMVEIKLEDED